MPDRRLFLLLVSVAGLLVHQAPARTQAPVLAITRVGVVDLIKGVVRPNVTVTIHGDRIARVAPGAPPAGARVVDGEGKFLIPGLWDMHTHTQAVGAESLDLHLANGVVGARDMGSDADVVLPLRDRIRRGEVRGPDLVVAGPILDAAPDDQPARRRVTGEADARAAVRDLHERGVDFIAVHDHTPREAFFAIADEIRRIGMPFGGVIPLAVTVQEGVAAGMQSVEHLGGARLFRECTGKARSYDPKRCAPWFQQMASKGLWQTPTIRSYEVMQEMLAGAPMPHLDYASDTLLASSRRTVEALKGDAAAQAAVKEMNANGLRVVRDMLTLGNVYLAGCGSGVPGFCLHDELDALVRAGLSPLQALRAATLNPAKLLGRTSTQGAVEANRRADLVLLDDNPLTDIRNARRIGAVVVRGQLLPRAELDAMLAARRRASAGTPPEAAPVR